jgi:RHS repeat-associated protein
MRVDVTNNWTLYYQEDHEGSVTHLTGTAGTVLEKYRYDAFGAPTINDANGVVITATAFSNRFLFTGREYRSTFGFYEYRARAYNPTLGRFTSQDPTLFDAGDYNLFRYCHNDPLDLTDPMGLAEEKIPRTVEQLWKYLQAREHALGWSGGAIAIGTANYQVGQMQAALSNFGVKVNSTNADVTGGRLAGAMGLKHQWISTSDGQSVGMDNKRSVGDPGTSANSLFARTYLSDHTGRLAEAQKGISGVDRKAISTWLQPGQSTGRWVPILNDCNSWVRSVLHNSTPHSLRVPSGAVLPVPGAFPLHFQSNTIPNIVQYSDFSYHAAGQLSY